MFVDPTGEGLWSSIKEFFKKLKNKDGSYSLYDNDRFKDENSWHEQFLVFTPSSKPSFNPKDVEIGIGSYSADLVTGGWEFENIDISLLDFGHAELTAQITNNGIEVNALASIYSPSTSFEIFGCTIEVGVEVGAVGGGFSVKSNKFSAGIAAIFGFNINISW